MSSGTGAAAPRFARARDAQHCRRNIASQGASPCSLALLAARHLVACEGHARALGGLHLQCAKCARRSELRRTATSKSNQAPEENAGS